MGYLSLSIFFSVAIFMAFKAMELLRLDTLQAIVSNYLVCLVTGLIFSDTETIFSENPIGKPWLWIAVYLGILFLVAFQLMAITVQKVGITVTSVANKISFAIPVVFSLWILQTEAKNYTVWNYTGMLLTIPAVLLTSYRFTGNEQIRQTALKYYLLPLAVFLLGGIIDTSINYANFRFLNGPDVVQFPLVVFLVSATYGAILLTLKLMKGQLHIEWRSIAGGFLLGIPNFFAFFFILKALEAFQNDGAFLYPIFNICIILGSTLVSVLLFGEKLNRLNWVGVLVAIMAIWLISYQEINAYWFQKGVFIAFFKHLQSFG